MADAVLWLKCLGATNREIAKATRMSNRTLDRFLAELKNSEDAIPQWLNHKVENSRWHRVKMCDVY